MRRARAGATAAWFREKYPNVTHAAFSSSGVVHAILEMTGFDEAVAAAIAIPYAAATPSEPLTHTPPEAPLPFTLVHAFLRFLLSP